MQIELSVLSLVVNDQTAADLEKATANIESLVHETRRYTGASPLGDLGRSGLPDVVILEINQQSDDAVQDIQHFLDRHGDHSDVIATFANPDMNLVKRLMRIGVRDVLSQPIGAEDLEAALTESLSRHQRQRIESAQGKISTFLNTRGGAGASFIALNVAYQLATEFNQKTVLVDMDIQYGTVAIDLDIRSEGTILEALRNPQRVDSVYLDALMTAHPSGLHVLPSPGDLSPSEDITAQAVTRMLGSLAESHDQVVVSLPTYFNEGVEQALRLANPVFLVSQDTMAMLRNLKLMLQRLPLRGVPASHLRVIQNRVNTAVKDISSRELDEILGNTPSYRVRSDYKLAAHAANEGKAATELNSRAGVVKDLREISAALAESSAPDKKKSGLMRWLS
ncbi:MAG: AAA family ATPase [Pseudomonadota bacterium]